MEKMKFLRPEEYQSRNDKIYAQIEGRISAILPDAEVEHIGSSSIDGAISKGDLDILVRVQKADFEGAILRIQSIGFNIKHDTLRTDSLCMLETQDFEVDVAIQLIEKDSEFENFCRFRDRLNKNPTLVEEYNSLKTNSIGISPAVYRLRKSEFIESVLGET